MDKKISCQVIIFINYYYYYLFQIVDNSESDFGSASHLNAKDFIISYDIENIPIVSDENSNVPDTIEVEINTQQLEIEVLDEKQINYCVTQKNVAKHKNWFECEHCKKGFCKLLILML